MPVKNFEIKMLGPFDKISFDFDKDVNIFIGPNNCGKSTVLFALAEAFTFPFGVPEKLFRKNSRPKIKYSLWNDIKEWEYKLPTVVCHEIATVMKNLGYTCFIPAIRLNTSYRPKSPTGKEKLSEYETGRESLYSYEKGREFDEDSEYPDQRYSLKYNKILANEQKKLSKIDATEFNKRRNWSFSPNRITDREIVSKIVELDYRAYRKGDKRYREPITLATNIVSEITRGFSVSFSRIEENHRGLFPEFKTPDGPFSLDKLSQGTQSIIQWVSYLIIGMAEYYDFPIHLNKKKAVFIIDEIDAHMHPEWQLRIIPTLLKNLPNCQFFISTHSPLILSGLKEGQVQLLNREENGRITVSRNLDDTTGWSVDQIMRWLMQMQCTFDYDTENIVNTLSSLRKKDRLSESEKETLEILREKIHNRLLSKNKSDRSSDNR